MPEFKNDDRPASPPYGLVYLVSILKLSSQWSLHRGREWSIDNLVAITSTIKPALRLRLARVYNIEVWIRPALERLIGTPLIRFHDDDRTWMGWQTYSLVARVRESAEKHRKTVALMPPKMEGIYHAACRDHEACGKVWHETWILKIGRALLHPEFLVALRYWQVQSAVEKLELTGMTKECREVMIRSLTGPEALAVFAVEDRLVDQAMQKMLEEIPVDKSAIDLKNGLFPSK